MVQRVTYKVTAEVPSAKLGDVLSELRELRVEFTYGEIRTTKKKAKAKKKVPKVSIKKKSNVIKKRAVARPRVVHDQSTEAA